jgi:hypothetical protein
MIDNLTFDLPKVARHWLVKDLDMRFNSASFLMVTTAPVMH